MPSDDRYADGATPARSLSEQLRELEAQLGHANEISLPAPGRRGRLPMSLGRPVGLTQPDGFPRILAAGPDARTLDDDAPPPRGSALRRGVVAVGVGLVLLAATAILPSLISPHVRAPAQSIAEEPPISARTEHFASVARELALAPRAPAIVAPPAATADDQPAPATTLEVAESELASLNLPKIVSGVAPATTGTAVVIDGLPDTARLSPGIRVGRDSWAVGIRDVDNAVLSLPHDTPERLDLVVRVVAADSHELAANRLHIFVRRAANAAAPVRAAAVSTAHFEPAAAVGALGLDAFVPLPARKPSPAAKPKASPAPSPTPAWPTAVSTWSPPPSSPSLLPVEKAPAWAPF